MHLQQQLDTLHQFEDVYTRIEQAVDQIKIMQVMEASTGVLRSLNKEVGGVETVENLVERLRDEIGKVKEVDKALEYPLNVRAVVDEDEISEELVAMEQEEIRKREEREAEVTRKWLPELEKQEKGRKADNREASGRVCGLTARGKHQEAEPDEH
jgi:charged multivesicular body protein 7